MAEPTLYGLDDFRAALEAAGWRIARNNLGAGQWNECNWYAWRRDDITPDCASNEKAPSLCVWPYASRIDISQRTGVGRAMVADIRRGKAWAPSIGAGSVFAWRPTA